MVTEKLTCWIVESGSRGGNTVDLQSVSPGFDPIHNWTSFLFCASKYLKTVTNHAFTFILCVICSYNINGWQVRFTNLFNTILYNICDWQVIYIHLLKKLFLTDTNKKSCTKILQLCQWLEYGSVHTLPMNRWDGICWQNFSVLPGMPILGIVLLLGASTISNTY
jgi:hypothetical protein